MGFTTTTFLFVFLPTVLILYFLSEKISGNFNSSIAGKLVLIVTSYIFYSWALATSGILLLIYSLIVFLIGKCIQVGYGYSVCVPLRYKDKRIEKNINVAIFPMILGVVCSIGLLYHFKYAYTVSTSISQFFYTDTNKYANFVTPLGISFITFSVISYFVDIYRGASAGTFGDCLLYVFFFPKVVSGPIVLWKDFGKQINNRLITKDRFISGMNLLAVGFAKKVILADTFGIYADEIKGLEIDVPTAWFGWILFALQIYYDFSGYSDIAIGLSKIFGFDIDKNFDFPYRSTSITEFWRRWHISLGTFFREYIYIPLGGNRKGYYRTLLNLAIVFLITGIWHGVGMAYIIWGLVHGVFVVLERIFRDKKWYRGIPRMIKWVGTFFISASAWQFFRYGGDGITAIANLAQLFGIHGTYTADDIVFTWQYYIDYKVITLLIIGFLGATVLGNIKLQEIYNRMKETIVGYVIQEVFVIALLFVAIIFMVSSTYSPFIYFQF